MFKLSKPKKQKQTEKNIESLKLIATNQKSLMRAIPTSLYIKQQNFSYKTPIHCLLLPLSIIFLFIYSPFALIGISIIGLPLIFAEIYILFSKTTQIKRLFYFIDSFGEDFLKNNRIFAEAALNNHFDAGIYSTLLYDHLTGENNHNKETIRALLSNTKNVKEIFIDLKENSPEVSLFGLLVNIKQQLSDNSDQTLLKEIINIYNEEFLICDLNRYMEQKKNSFNKEIFEHIKKYGARADLFYHFQNLNKTIKPNNQNRLENAKPNNFEFDLQLNKTHINF